MVQRIKFQGQEYVLVGDPKSPWGAAIATAEAFAEFRPSYAHVFGDRILRHGVQIGKADEIEYLGREDE